MFSLCAESSSHLFRVSPEGWRSPSGREVTSGKKILVVVVPKLVSGGRHLFLGMIARNFGCPRTAPKLYFMLGLLFKVSLSTNVPDQQFLKV